MSRSRLLLAALLLALAGCSFRFDPQHLVKYRRVLAVQADPPEFIVTNVNDLATATVQLTALVVDPADDGSAVPYVWRNCVEFLGETGQWNSRANRCVENDVTLMQQATKDMMPLGVSPSGSAPMATYGTSPVEFSLTNVLNALTAGQGGPLGSGVGLVTGIFDGAGTTSPAVSLWVDTMLRVGEGSTALYAVKRVVVSPAVPAGRTANKIPHLVGLLFDEKPWQPNTPVPVQLGVCDEKKKVQIPNLDAQLGDPTSFTVCRHTITPVFDPSQSESYMVQTFDKDSTGAFIELPLKERLRFQWQTDHGSFDQNETEEPDTFGVYDYDPISVHWDEPHAPKETSATMWVVIKDGRGGESWEIRKIAYGQ